MSDIKPTIREDVQAQKVGDELVVLDNNSGQVHQLNVSASFIWENCNGEQTVKDIAHAMADYFGINQEQALSDVNTVIQEFHGKSLLVI